MFKFFVNFWINVLNVWNCLGLIEEFMIMIMFWFFKGICVVGVVVGGGVVGLMCFWGGLIILVIENKWKSLLFSVIGFISVSYLFVKFSGFIKIWKKFNKI